MADGMPFDISVPSAFVSTGALPPVSKMRALVNDAHARFAGLGDGAVADYIPALASADPALFAIAVVGTDGASVTCGECHEGFTIQSISKPFVFALVAQALGAETAKAKLGVNATGMPFDSVMAIEMGDYRATNPMVNAGAIAATSLMPGDTAEAKWEAILTGMSRFAGRQLVMDEAVFASEMATNLRNRGIAALLESYGKLGCPPDMAVEVYTRQCSVTVTATDLATMAATLANGGVKDRKSVV